MTYHDMCDVGMMWDIIVNLNTKLLDANNNITNITNTYLAGKECVI